MSKAKVHPNGKRLFELRSKRGLTQAELATLAGYDKRTIDRIENGKPTSLTTLSDISDVLGVEAEFLCDGHSEARHPLPQSHGSSAADTLSGQQELEITIDANFDSFTLEDERLFLRALRDLSGIVGKIVINDIRRGSVILRLSISGDDAARLLAAADDGRLDAIGVRACQPIPSVTAKDLEARRNDELVASQANPGSDSSSSGDVTSLSLLIRARNNDDAAWVRLIQLYTPLVYHWCRRMNLREDEVADVLQEVFRSVLRKLGDFEHQRRIGSFRRWLKTITVNKARDHFRKQQRDVQATSGLPLDEIATLVPAPETLDDDESDHETSMLCHRVLELTRAEFSEVQFEAFRMLVMDEMPADAVAAKLGVTRNVVYLAKSRILNRLRIEFSSLVDDETPETDT